MLRYYAGLGLELKGETIPAPNNIHFTLREPYGVVGRIIPFNHPLQFAASKMAAPLMAANAVVMKPSEQSPLTATVLSEICAELFPPGVVNILTGFADAGIALTKHPKVRRLALIGSAQTGMAMQRAGAETAVKHITLELGGKNPSIVFPDADVARVVEATMSGMNFGHQGQSCGSLSRLFLHESLYDSVLPEVVKRVEALRVGDPLDPQTQMGAMNSKPQYEKVLHYIRAGQEDGARLAAGGRKPQGEIFNKGFWVRPTVFAEVTPKMRIFREEIFGPVLSVIRWSDVDDVIEMANSTQYGLTAAIWTRDVKTAFQTARRIQAGYISINGRPGHFPGVSFGGVKDSGLGTEEGFDELLSYTVPKVINIIL
jgi:acyl-CoA reductase-like NAD-dependent aldehyde dehydrogenase